MNDEQTNCTKCGVTILLLTAKETGGVCMVCARGSRADFEENRRRMRQFEAEQEAFRASPPWQFWLRLVRTDFAAMSEAEQFYFAVGEIRGHVQSEGVQSYFMFSRVPRPIVERALSAMGADKALQLYRTAAKAILDGAQDGDVYEQAWRRKEDKRLSAELEALNPSFWAEYESLWELLQSFAQRNQLFPSSPV